jgi:hypothetical protein
VVDTERHISDIHAEIHCALRHGSGFSCTYIGVSVEFRKKCEGRYPLMWKKLKAPCKSLETTSVQVASQML